MALATGGNASAFVSGGNPLIAYKLWSPKTCSFVKAPTLTVQNNFSRQIACHKLPAHAQYKCAHSCIRKYGYECDICKLEFSLYPTTHMSDSSFVLVSTYSHTRVLFKVLLTFLCGGGPSLSLSEIRRSLLNEDEYGFREAKKPIYYDEGLEKTRQTVNEKINQLNSAIDNVSSRLRGGHSMPLMPSEADPGETTM